MQALFGHLTAAGHTIVFVSRTPSHVRLVADDVIECDYRPPGMVFGQPAALLRHHIEVRGLGILNIKDLFGVTAIRERKRVDLVVGNEVRAVVEGYYR